MAEIRHWPGLDLVKFVCVCSMILVHMFIWFLFVPKGLNTGHPAYQVMSNFLFIAFFNLAIPATAGSTLRFYISKGPKKIILISLLIALLGYMMNPIAFGQRWAFSWNVLQFIALSFVMITMLNSINKYLIYLVAISSLVFIDYLRQFFIYVGNPYLDIAFVGNDSGIHLWPLFPWFTIVVLGYFISDLYMSHNSRKFTAFSLILGLFFSGLALAFGNFLPSLDPAKVWGSSLFQPEIGVMLMVMSSYCFLMAFAELFSRKIKFRKYGIINSYSHGILWAYLALMIIGYRLMGLLKSIFGQNALILVFMLAIMPFILWLVGYLSIRLLHDRKIRIFIRKSS